MLLEQIGGPIEQACPPLSAQRIPIRLGCSRRAHRLIDVFARSVDNGADLNAAVMR